MFKPTPQELIKILSLHKEWLLGNSSGVRANLYGVDLTGADLTRADLTGANLTGADLTRANLYGVDLTGANLSGANLYGANLTRADLTRADLTRANLYGVNLTGANLYGANLYGANLYGANLTRADLYGVNLYGVDLTGANLYGANLYGVDLTGANLYGAKNTELILARTVLVPEGDLIVWKKCLDNVLVKLLVPNQAKRSNALGRKCRAEYVIVLEVFGGSEGKSMYNRKVVYRTGETVKCDTWESNRLIECGGGIHFFLTRLEAEAYTL